ncbi:unnamed protein product [Durusdinium trenchii]|uniref:Uncharacterized protein n=1 Tax=Durusdinium trenchii TaxID=1381693 RepID=A0ABP0QHK0_9DINO
MCLEKKTCVQDRPYLRRRRPNRPQGRTSQTSLTAAEAEAEGRRRAAHLLALSREVEATQAELAFLRQPQTGAPVQQAQHLVGAFVPELRMVKAKLGQAGYIAAQLDRWFVEHREKMMLADTDLSQMPSRQLHGRLQSCEQLVESFASCASRMEGMLQEAVQGTSAEESPSPAGAAVATPVALAVGQRPNGPTVEGARPGGAGVPGLWVRDPDKPHQPKIS